MLHNTVIVYIIIILLLVTINVLIKLNRKHYRLGNYIDLWYDEPNIFTFFMNRILLMNIEIEGFAKYLSENKPIQYKKPQRFETCMKMWQNNIANMKSLHLYFWCYDYIQYQYLYPSFNVSLRHAISNYFGTQRLIDPSICVVHYRVGDALCHGKGIWSVEKVLQCIELCFKKYKHLTHLMLMDGGKNHFDTCMIKYDPMIDFKSRIHDLGIRIIPNQGKSADEDFIQMVQASVLITGVGSFACMAAAANENVRYTPNLFNILGERIDRKGSVHHIYEHWYTYG